MQEGRAEGKNVTKLFFMFTEITRRGSKVTADEEAPFYSKR